MAAAMICLLIAAATFLFGDDNVLQNNGFVSLILLILFFVGIYKINVDEKGNENQRMG